MLQNTPQKAKVAVALSGGLDSLMSAWLLQEQGYEVIGVHAKFISKPSSYDALQKACDFLHIPLHILDLQQAFQKNVIDPFIQTYLQAKTPNPCALCNPALKFGLLMDESSRLGAEYLATGHYARIGQFNPSPSGHSNLDGREEGFYTIYPAQDLAKDQSYFLALVPQERLKRVIFPLKNREKPELRALAEKLGLPVPEPKESQEICFVPNDDYRAFLENSGCNLPVGGPMLLADGSKVGQHKGLWQYTEGQRRGLGIAAPAPLYVIAKDVANNALIVGTKEHFASYECEAERLNIFVPYEYWPEQVLVRVRYRQKAVPAQVVIFASAKNGEQSRMRITFNQAQDPPAKGQLAVVYHPQGFILAGGIIC